MVISFGSMADRLTFFGWWLTYPSEKYESVGMMKFPNEWKITFMFQTINQMNITNIRIEHVIRVEHIDMLKNT